MNMQRASNVTCLVPYKLSDSAFGEMSEPSYPSSLTGLSGQRQGYTYRTQSWCALIFINSLGKSQESILQLYTAVKSSYNWACNSS